MLCKVVGFICRREEEVVTYLDAMKLQLPTTDLNELKEIQKLLREREILKSLFGLLRAPFPVDAAEGAGPSGGGLDLERLQSVRDKSDDPIRQVCSLCFRIIRHLQHDYRNSSSAF